MASKDHETEKRIQTLLDEANIPVAVIVEDDVARLIGQVTSSRLRRAAIDLASASNQITRVQDEMNYEVVSPDMPSEAPDDDEEFAYVDEQSLAVALSGEEMSFQSDETPRDDSTLDYEEEQEDRETYFPPTDPVVEPSRYGGDLEIVGGFQSEATDLTDEESDEAYNGSVSLENGDRLILRDDDDIRIDVARELREDALTTDLRLDVVVRGGVVFLNGEVQTIDDAENAQEVASRVAGVIDVEDRTRTEQE